MFYPDVINRVPGVYYAATDEGTELPIIDVRNPVFACPVSKVFQSTVVQSGQYRTYLSQIPADGVSPLLSRCLLTGTKEFLTGMSTYLLKLGAQNFVSPIDQKIAASPPAQSLRMRLQHMAEFMAAHLEPLLLDKTTAPLHMINIAGGSAMDSINALLLIPKSDLSGRTVTIHLLDLRDAGPHFAMKAIAKLQSAGAPLSGIDIQIKYHPYDWSNTGPLSSVVSTIPASSICVASSEGGLFEYGADSDVIANLRLLRPRASLFVGSFFRDDPIGCTFGFPVVPRSLAIASELVDGAGWAISQTATTPLNYLDVALQ